jgi:hypothetical protein
MGFTTKNIRVSVNFCHKLAFFGKNRRHTPWILSRNLKILKPVKAYKWDHYVYLIHNLGFATKKHGVSASFSRNCRFSAKPKANPFGI